MSQNIPVTEITAAEAKFTDPDFTLDGDTRAAVDPRVLETLWINTGSLCNLTCENCYIESSPTNDRLAYISLREVCQLLDEIESEKMGTGKSASQAANPF